MQIYLSTTGTQSSTLIPDLGNVSFLHPLTTIPLIEPLGEFTENDIVTSSDLLTSVALGYITLSNIDGSNISTLNDITSKIEDHGNLVGLLNDTHTQYLNNTRGDVRYFTKAESNANYLSSTLTDGTILVGNSSNIASPVTLTGDSIISNTGVLTLSNIGTNGTYKSVTTDNKGRVIAGTNPTTLAQYGIVDAQPLNADLTSLAALNTTGIITRSAANTFVDRTLTGTLNRITVTDGDGVIGNPLINIASTYIGQNTITTLGTITSGLWNGSIIPIAFGGTGSSTSSTAINNLLPSQIGNTNEVLSTDGTNVNWLPLSLQQIYALSSNPEIITNSSNGAITLRRGSTLETDNVLEVQNTSGISNFTVTGEGTTSVLKSLGTTNLIVAPSISDPNINTKTPTIYTEVLTTVNADGFRLYCNSGSPATSAYINAGYDGAAPLLSLVDMDDDPCYIDFSTARLGLTSPGPGTFTAPAIVNRFGARGPASGATSGFSWWTNKGVSGGTLSEILSCDSNFLRLPSIITADRPPTPVNGMLAYNSNLTRLDFYENNAWTQHVDVTSTQSIAGNKTFTNKILCNTNISQYFNSALVTTSSATFTTITGMSLNTANTVVSKYRVSTILNIKHSTASNTTVAIQILVNGVLDSNTLYTYAASTSTIPVSVSIEKIFTGVTSPTTYAVQWRRVSGTAVVSVTNKSLIIQEIL